MQIANILEQYNETEQKQVFVAEYNFSLQLYMCSLPLPRQSYSLRFQPNSYPPISLDKRLWYAIFSFSC